MNELKGFLARPLFKIDGLTFTVGIVIAIVVVIWYVKFRKR